MADFSSLKQTIQTYIKQNGNEEITGNILQDVLLAMVTTMGDSAINGLVSALQDEIAARQNQDGTLQGNITAETTARRDADTALGGRIDGLQTAINGINTKLAEGYIYAGIATPSTNPGTPSGKVFYIAVQEGTYTNFGGTVVTEGITILKYNGTSWVKEQAMFTDGGVFDISAYNNDTYDDLADALSGTNVPTNVRKGGMSVKFVQSSDNKYVQYFLAKDEWSVDETDWQKINLEEEISQLGREISIINVNTVANHQSAYTSKADARGDVPVRFQKKGMVITYFLNDHWEIEQYNHITDAYSTSDIYWKKIETDVELSISASPFVDTVDIKKTGTVGNNTKNFANAIKWVRLYKADREKVYHIGISRFYYSNNQLQINIYDYDLNVVIATIRKTYDVDITTLHNEVLKDEDVELCVDLDYNFGTYSVYDDSTINGNTYESRGFADWKINKVFIVDNGLDADSENPVQNKVVSEKISKILVDKTLKELSQVCVSGYREIKDFDTYSGIVRKSTNKVEDTSSNEYGIFYFKVHKGEKINIVADGVSAYAAWTVVAFSGVKPQNGVLTTPVQTASEDGAQTFNINYTPSTDGYIIITWRGTSLKAQIALYSIKQVPNVSDYSGFVRKSTAKCEDASSSSYGSIYFPAYKGVTYRMIGNGVKGLSAWNTISFVTETPANNVSAIRIAGYDGSEYDAILQLDSYYTPTADGYIIITWVGTKSLILNSWMVVAERRYIEEDVSIAHYNTMVEAIQNNNGKFYVGNVLFNTIVDNPSLYTPNVTNTQFNELIKQYLPSIQSKSYSKIITDKIVNMFSAGMDAPDYDDSMCRQVIGVDSCGNIYVTQKYTTSDLPIDSNVQILVTKDFETFDVFKASSCGLQLIELENGELCFATIELESGGYYCNIYVTSSGKTVFNKKFHTTHNSSTVNGTPWAWGLQSRGNVVAVSEYGSHGTLGSVWYSRDCGGHFYHVFEHQRYAPDYPHAHIHGICIDPYFDRLYVITGDGLPATTNDLLYKNDRIYWWDYNGETLSDSLYQTIDWNYLVLGADLLSGESLQFVYGYALKDCVLFSSDGQGGGIFRINRTKKEDMPVIDYAIDLGLESYTKWCGGNIFRLNEDSPLLICMHREYSQDLEPDSPDNPSHSPNTYKDNLSRIYATYDGYTFTEVWIDDTYGEYNVWLSTDWSTPIQRNLAKCGRDMSVYQMPDGKILIKYIGRSFSYLGYNNNGVTATDLAGWHRFNNECVIGHLK